MRDAQQRITGTWSGKALVTFEFQNIDFVDAYIDWRPECLNSLRWK